MTDDVVQIGDYDPGGCCERQTAACSLPRFEADIPSPGNVVSVQVAHPGPWMR